MKLECGIWLAGNERIFEPACARILEAVGRCGSLHKATAELRVSNDWAWRTVKIAERRLGFPLLDRRVGGREGGGSTLTPQGREPLARYSAAQAEMEAQMAEVFARHFAGWGEACCPHSSR